MAGAHGGVWAGRTTCSTPYLAAADKDLLALYGRDHHTGITATAGGFYGPQGTQRARVGRCAGPQRAPGGVRARRASGDQLRDGDQRPVRALGYPGHAACTVCTVVANRAEGTFLEDHHAAMWRP